MSEEGKTLEQLWEENGCKPFRVRHRTWFPERWFYVAGKTPYKEEFPWCGHDEMMRSDALPESDDASWYLVKEPKKKKKLYRALFKNQIGRFWISDLFFKSKDDASDYYGSCVRLLTEKDGYPPIEVEED